MQIKAALWFALLLLAYGKTNAQFVNRAYGYSISFGMMQPRSEFAKEAYGNAWQFGIKPMFGTDVVNVQPGIGFESFRSKREAYSADPLMDSILQQNRGGRTSNLYLSGGIEVGTTINAPVRFSVKAEGDAGIYFGKSSFIMRQMLREQDDRSVQWSTGFTLTARLEGQLFSYMGVALSAFAEGGVRGHAGAIQPNRFLIANAGLSVWVFELE